MSVFLTAEWRNLLMLNYEADASILRPFVPAGTELDSFRGKHFVSVVGFLFANTKVWGIGWPGCVTFEEVNLRFYVRREVRGEGRRGVVFVREIVPRKRIAFLARALYGERYISVPMEHRFDKNAGLVEYTWQSGERRNYVRGYANGEFEPLADDSEEQFIAEHYWGYTRRAGDKTLEYRVNHEPWLVAQTRDANVDVDIARFYGRAFTGVLRGRPATAFLAKGSRVAVMSAKAIASTGDRA